MAWKFLRIFGPPRPAPHRAGARRPSLPAVELLEDRLVPSTAHLALVADYGQPGQPELDVSNLIKSWNPQAIVTVGDNNYPMATSANIDANIGQYYHSYI